MSDDDHDDHPREACGVFGIYAPGLPVARITYFGLYALQHRGQESAGIAVGDGLGIRLRRGMGLVSQIFREEDMADLRGGVAIGHCRYATTGASELCNAQPFVVAPNTAAVPSPIALAHNGNLVNAGRLRAELDLLGVRFESGSDSEVIARLIAQLSFHTWEERLLAGLPRLQGAFSLVFATPDALYAARDPWGIRPLCLGLLDGHYIVASESCALQTVGAELVREIEPGELVRIDRQGLASLHFAAPRPHICSFEFIYFARPDSQIEGRSVYATRLALGRRLAQECPAEADLVIGVPDSALPMALGYARESGIPYGEGLVKNRYIGRTFIAPSQLQRDRGIHLKFNPLPEVLEGKRVIVIEDSIVRGTTSRPLVALLRGAGAREIHLRIASPPYRHPCFLGLDTGRREELIAARMDVEAIRAHIGADSLAYLAIPGLVDAIGLPAHSACRGCLEGAYPMPIAEAEEPSGALAASTR